MKRLLLFAAVAVLMASAVLSLSGCADESSPPADGVTPGDATVVMRGQTFQPAMITVSAGDTVTWVNEDAVVHNVSGDGFSSGSMGGGDTFRPHVRRARHILLHLHHPSRHGRHGCRRVRNGPLAQLSPGSFGLSRVRTEKVPRIQNTMTRLSSEPPHQPMRGNHRFPATHPALSTRVARSLRTGWSARSRDSTPRLLVATRAPRDAREP
jgi:plastocyanin